MARIFILLLAGAVFFPGCDHEAKLEKTRLRAEAGDATSQNELGRMYFFGAGVQQDNVIAYAWTAVAEANGHPDAKKNKDNIAKDMTPEQVERAKKMSEELQRQVDEAMNEAKNSGEK